jgi:SAM-dependent methyltransferase
MAPSQVDTDGVREHWNAISAGWMRWQEAFERGGAAVTARLIGLAGIQPGHRVLDVGTGLGEPALTIAGHVGPGGRVLGIDPSDEMVRLARTRASGVSNVEFIDADIASFDTDERFDAIVSRWCLMLLPDRVAVLRKLFGLLRPGGVLAAAVWGPAPTAPMISLPFPVLAARLELPPPRPGEPGPYAMADPAVCRADLDAAGFAEVAVVEHAAPFWMSGVEEYVRFARDVLPVRLQRMLAQRFGSVDDPQTWQAVAGLAARYAANGNGVALTSTALCMAGVR